MLIFSIEHKTNIKYKKGRGKEKIDFVVNFDISYIWNLVFQYFVVVFKQFCLTFVMHQVKEANQFCFVWVIVSYWQYMNIICK